MRTPTGSVATDAQPKVRKILDVNIAVAVVVLLRSQTALKTVTIAARLCLVYAIPNAGVLLQDFLPQDRRLSRWEGPRVR